MEGAAKTEEANAPLFDLDVEAPPIKLTFCIKDFFNLRGSSDRERAQQCATVSAGACCRYEMPREHTEPNTPSASAASGGT